MRTLPCVWLTTTLAINLSLFVFGGDAQAQTPPPTPTGDASKTAPPGEPSTPETPPSTTTPSEKPPEPPSQPPPTTTTPPIEQHGEVDSDQLSRGLHASVGVGPSGHFAAGLASQIKIGARLTPKLRLFVHSLGHWYTRVDRRDANDLPVPGPQNVKTTRTQWRVAALTGVGLDYFVVPRIALRTSIGLGSDLNTEFGDDPNALGYSFLFGASFEVFNLDRAGEHRLTVDPFIHMLQHNQANIVSGPTEWVSRPIIGVTLNWAYR